MDRKKFAEECAAEIVGKFLVYKKINMSYKTLWTDEIIEFLAKEKQDYNMAQHTQVIKIIPTMDTTHGIDVLLNFIKNVQKVKPVQIADKSESVYALNARIWDSFRNDEDKEEFIKNSFIREEFSDATKYWIRSWMRSVGWTSERIRSTLGYVWK